jgi:intein/homing endonuclease
MVFFTKIKRNWEPHKMRITARLHNNNNLKTCILWKETYFEESTCAVKKTIDNSFYKINIKSFKKIEVTKETMFFKNGNPLVWYGKSFEGKVEFFNQRGIHPITLKGLDPITKYMINKYVF